MAPSNSFRTLLSKFFANPDVENADLNSTASIALHREIIRKNPLLQAYYCYVYKYYAKIENSLSYLNGPSLEIGSGGGFLKEYIPVVITSDVVPSDGIDKVEDVTRLSFGNNSLKAVYANGVLHHVKDPVRCLTEIQRVLLPGGMFVCNEPSSTLFGYFQNRHFHHEYTNRFTKEWRIEKGGEGGRLTGANMALPFIIFKRDRKLFEGKFKKLKIKSIIYHDFLRYCLSGGLSYRPFVPARLCGVVNMLEAMAKPLMPAVGQLMIVTIQKI